MVVVKNNGDTGRASSANECMCVDSGAASGFIFESDGSRMTTTTTSGTALKTETTGAVIFRIQSAQLFIYMMHFVMQRLSDSQAELDGMRYPLVEQAEVPWRYWPKAL